MHHTLNRLSLAIATAGLLTLAACGGGGGSTSSSNNPTISGIAATGAAFTDATVSVIDSRGTTVGTASVGTDGSYTVTLAAGATAPYVLSASRTNGDGVTETLVSVLPTATTRSATVNITPVSTLIAARLSPSGDPSKLAVEISAGSATVDAATVDAKVTEVKTILAPILTATGTSSFDPLGGTFTANGTGYDRLLDSIKVTIIPDSSSTTNIEIGIKQQQAEGTAPLAIQFSSSQSTSTITTNNNITGTAIGGTNVSDGNLLRPGTSEKIAAHLTQLTSCYALAPSVRVPTGTTAADIAATECTNAFYGNNPANFKSNGKIVSATGAFSGIFNSGVQNVVFSQGQYEFTRATGDIVIRYKSKTASGAESYDTFALREDSDGKLKQIGNQYDYGGGVAAYHQIRRFPALGQSASNYYSTGYNITIPKNSAAYSYVAVTTPRGNTVIYKPQTGFDNLQLVKGWTGTADAPDFTSSALTGSSFIRIRSEYADLNNTADPAVTSDGSRLFFVPTAFTNEQIAQLGAQGVWTFKYYLVGTPNTLVATQYYKTRSRALTIPELRTQSWAVLTDAQITDLQSASITPAGVSGAGQIPVTDGRTSFALSYSVPSGALPPTSLQVWGRYAIPAGSASFDSSASFSDTSSVASTARSGSVACANAGGGDNHCVSGGYSNPTRINGIHLWSRDTTGREFANFYAWYQL